MRLLVFDTSFSACSVALVDTGAAGAGAAPASTAARNRTIASCYEPMQTGQAVRLMPMIDNVMKIAGVALADLDGIATSNGPGTFTGIRIAVATARALALSTGLPVFGISALALVASTARSSLGAQEKGRVLAATMDARRDELYVQLFADPQQPALTLPHLLDADSAARLTGKPLIAVGTGATIFCDAAARLGRPAQARLEHTQPDAAYSHAVHMQQLNPIKPLYLRRPDAKPQTAGAISMVSQ